MVIKIFFLIIFQSEVYSSEDALKYTRLPREVPAAAMQCRTLYDPHLRPLTLGLT